MAKRRRRWSPLAPGIPFWIAEDVQDWVYELFSSANRYVSRAYSRVPSTNEPHLDTCLLSDLQLFKDAALLPSGYKVQLHALSGAGRSHYHGREIADIIVLVTFEQSGSPARTKIVLFQSKRLYPYSKTGPVYATPSVAAIYHPTARAVLTAASATIEFKSDCKYMALKAQDAQQTNIENFTNDSAMPVYYLLYHPHKRLPTTLGIPVRHAAEPKGANLLGCRVVPFAAMKNAMNALAKGQSPSYDELCNKLPSSMQPHPGAKNQFRLERFMADMVMGCHIGTFVETLTPKQQVVLQPLVRIDGAFAVSREIGEEGPAVIAMTITAPPLAG